MLSRHIARCISDNNSRNIFLEVKKNSIPYLQLGTLFCALVDCSHQAMTALFEYSGSLALLVANWLISARTHISITDINPIRKLNALINIKHGTSQQEERHKGEIL